MSKRNEQTYLSMIEEVNATGPYKPTWESLAEAPVPKWFRSKRLGIFIHWGVYSVPASFNEWYSRNMYIQGTKEFEHHIKTWGPHKEFGYKDFIPMFRAEQFDATAWLELFQYSGAGYVLPVAEHHDGFQMYESDLSQWNAAQMGPMRDVLGELKRAASDKDLAFCASTHRAEHWFFMGHGKEFDSDIHEPLQKGDFYWPAMQEADHFDVYSQPWPTEEFCNDWMARTAEIIVKYQPKLLYFDWWILHQAFVPYLKKLAAFYYNCGKRWGEDVLICYKHDAMMFGTGIVEVERGSLAEAKPYPWQTDTAVARNSWCYTDSLVYKSTNEIVCTLIDVVSKGGNLLLNIGPKADGTIPAGDEKILRELGDWMAVNAEAIHDTKCWRFSAEGPTQAAEGQFQDGKEVPYTSQDYRFTTGHGAIYAHCLRCPKDGNFLVTRLATPSNYQLPVFQGEISDVQILGYNGPLQWNRDGEGLHVSAEIQSDMPVVIKVIVN